MRSAIISGTAMNCQKARDMVDAMVAEVTITVVTQPHMFCVFAFGEYDLSCVVSVNFVEEAVVAHSVL